VPDILHGISVGIWKTSMISPRIGDGRVQNRWPGNAGLGSCSVNSGSSLFSFPMWIYERRCRCSEDVLWRVSRSCERKKTCGARAECSVTRLGSVENFPDVRISKDRRIARASFRFVIGRPIEERLDIHQNDIWNVRISL
jgi:hypothetical protein